MQGAKERLEQYFEGQDIPAGPARSTLLRVARDSPIDVDLDDLENDPNFDDTELANLLLRLDSLSEDALSIQVTDQRGGRSILTFLPLILQWQRSSGFRPSDLIIKAVLRWRYDRHSRMRTPTSITYSAPGGNLPHGPFAETLFPSYFDCYIALLIHADREQARRARGRLPLRRPEPGKPFDMGFYKALLAAYDRLVDQGYKAPAREIAERMRERPSTVKSWLHRARNYLGKEN